MLKNLFAMSPFALSNWFKICLLLTNGPRVSLIKIGITSLIPPANNLDKTLWNIQQDYSGWTPWGVFFWGDKIDGIKFHI